MPIGDRQFFASAGPRFVGTLALVRWIRPAGEPFASSRKASRGHGSRSRNRCGFAGVATASRSDVRSERRLSDPAVGSTMASPSNKWLPTPPATNQPRRQRPTRPATDPTPTTPPTPPQPTHSATHRRNSMTTPQTATPKPPKTTTTEHHLQSLTNARTRVDTLAGSAERNPTGVIPGAIREQRETAFVPGFPTIAVTTRAATVIRIVDFGCSRAHDSTRGTGHDASGASALSTARTARRRGPSPHRELDQHRLQPV